MTDGKTLKEMLNILTHQRNANQNNSTIPSYTCQNGKCDPSHFCGPAFLALMDVVLLEPSQNKTFLPDQRGV
ncbi:hypothetical protein STEG23_023178 [Scotinomys teguina]